MTAIARPTQGSSDLRASLAPAREALLHDAEARAAMLIDEATRAADDIVADAEREAHAAIDKAVRRRQETIEARSGQELERVRRDAHAAVLATRAELRRRLIDEVHSAATAMRHDPRYPALLDHLEAVARARLGQGATIDRDPEADGGVRAHTETRRLDYTLCALADRALDALADEVVTLWT